MDVQAVEATENNVPKPNDPNQKALLIPHEWTREQIDLIKGTVAQGTSDNELKLFLYTAKQTGLDPLLRQIHAVKRWSSALGRDAMAIQTGIDGYRLIAERTGRYTPGREPTYEERDGKLYSSTSYVKKHAKGEWHEVAATAFWDEYVQKKKDGTPNAIWGRMPRLMLAKVAEALALRKGFPAEMGGVYTDDEMAQADGDVPVITSPKRTEPPAPKRAEAVNVEPVEAAVVTASVEPNESENGVLSAEIKPTKVTVGRDGEGSHYKIEGEPPIGVLHTRNQGMAMAAKNAMTAGQKMTVYYVDENGQLNLTAIT